MSSFLKTWQWLFGECGEGDDFGGDDDGGIRASRVQPQAKMSYHMWLGSAVAVPAIWTNSGVRYWTYKSARANHAQ